MASTVFEGSSDPFVVLGQDMTSQKKQLAQYSVLQAATFLQNGRNDQAVGAFKRALAIDPQNATANNYLGKIYLSQGKNADSIKAYQQLVRIQSNQSIADTSGNAPTKVDAITSLANAYLQDKQYAASEKQFKLAISLAPQNPLPVYTLGLQYSNTDRLAEAETQFLKAKKISPTDGNVYYALGMVYNKQGRSEEAAANLEKALSLKKNFPAANYELGVAYDALGKTDDAQKQLTILQTSSPTQATNLKFILDKPAMIYMDTKKSGSFMGNLGPSTPLWMLDPTLLTPPSSSKAFSVTIGFNTSMDVSSVTNTQNWSISRANSAGGGYYNNTMPLSTHDAALPATPETVFYDSTSQEATLVFRLNQDSTGSTVIDPSHVVFAFNGKDSSGRPMDKTANEVDGYNITPF